jgi:catalase
MRFDENGGGGPNYWPNTFAGPAPDVAAADPQVAVEGLTGRHEYSHPSDDFVQAGDLYRDVMTDEERDHLVGNIVGHLSGAQKRIRLRQCALFYGADPDYGTRVAQGVGVNAAEVQRLAPMSPEERAEATMV